MSSNRFAPLLVLTALLLGCSRNPEPPQSAPAATSSAARTAQPRQVSEEQALDLLMARLKARKVADLACLDFFNEDGQPSGTKADSWEFAAHEIHDAKCGGDPGVSPVRDRYKISSAGNVQVYDAAEDEYKKF